MNVRHEDAYLDGYCGPYFPDELSALEKVIGSRHTSNSELMSIATKSSYYQPVRHQSKMTRDGYGWFASLVFRSNHDQVVILFPWTIPDDSGFVRSFAAYSLVGNTEAIAEIITDYTELWIDHLVHEVSTMWQQEIEWQRFNPNSRWHM